MTEIGLTVVAEAVEFVGNRHVYEAVGKVWAGCGQLAVHKPSIPYPQRSAGYP